jgi:hypothetical protein
VFILKRDLPILTLGNVGRKIGTLVNLEELEFSIL